MLPNVIIIGAMKTGTGSVHEYLASHPQVFMSKRKELHFFVDERTWGRGLDWYEEQFAEAGSAIAIGESSTSYSMFPVFEGVPARMRGIVPDVRIIYLVRDPIDRLRSHYLENVYFDLEARERVWGRWERDPIRPERAPIEEALLGNPVYISTSRYAMQLEQYLEHFDREQILVLTTEQLRDAREETIKRVYRFAGVDDTWTPPVIEEEFNRTAGKRVPRPLTDRLRRLPGYHGAIRALPQPVRDRLKPRLTTKELDPGRAVISPGLRAELVAQLEDDVRRLRHHLGDDFDGWGIA